jgi:hypothetical protein
MLFSYRSAAWGGHVGAVEVLLARGADVERADAEGRTALRAAAWGTLIHRIHFKINILREMFIESGL